VEKKQQESQEKIESMEEELRNQLEMQSESNGSLGQKIKQLVL
jgi:hypothetical protein